MDKQLDDMDKSSLSMLKLTLLSPTDGAIPSLHVYPIPIHASKPTQAPPPTWPTPLQNICSCEYLLSSHGTRGMLAC